MIENIEDIPKIKIMPGNMCFANNDAVVLYDFTQTSKMGNATISILEIHTCYDV
jgi:hypothetical protein